MVRRRFHQRSCWSGTDSEAQRTSGSWWPKDVSWSLMLSIKTIIFYISGLSDAVTQRNKTSAYLRHLEREEKGTQTERGSSTEDAQLAPVGCEDHIPSSHWETSWSSRILAWSYWQDWNPATRERFLLQGVLQTSPWMGRGFATLSNQSSQEGNDESPRTKVVAPH